MRDKRNMDWSICECTLHTLRHVAFAGEKFPLTYVTRISINCVLNLFDYCVVVILNCLPFAAAILCQVVGI
jgi:hypothetical protein